jgi:hypothetical protein
MDSYLTLISANANALRLPKINGLNDLVTTMGYGIFSEIDDVPEDAALYSVFSFQRKLT